MDERPTGHEPQPEEEDGAPLEAAQRLLVLLFVLREKLKQRHSLYHKATGALLILCACCLAAVIFGSYYVFVVSPPARSFWTLAYFAALAAGPFALALIHYFWITFAQIFFQGLPDVALLLRTSEYRQFGGLVPLEVLTDDSSLLSLFVNLFAVDVGLSSSLFFVCAALLLIAPPLVQAGLSAGMVYVMVRDGWVFLALGLGVLYVLFLILTCVKGWSFYRSLRRGAGQGQ